MFSASVLSRDDKVTLQNILEVFTCVSCVQHLCITQSSHGMKIVVLCWQSCWELSCPSPTEIAKECAGSSPWQTEGWYQEFQVSLGLNTRSNEDTKSLGDEKGKKRKKKGTN